MTQARDPKQVFLFSGRGDLGGGIWEETFEEASRGSRLGEGIWGGASGITQGRFGITWDHLGSSIWDHLGSSGLIWGHLQSSGIV